MSKKVNMLKGIGVLCSVMLLSVSIASPPVFASENMQSESTSTTSEVNVYVSDEVPDEMEAFEEFCAHMMSGNTLQEGEERVIGIFNGEKLYVRVTYVAESSSSAYTAASEELTESAVYVFYTKNVLGVKKDVLNVTLKCTWIKGSKIINLNGTYTKLVTDIYCSWNDNYKSATDTFHTLGLDVTYNGKSGIVFFSAISLDLQTLTLSSSVDGEL